MSTEIQAKIAALVDTATQDAYREGYAHGRRDVLSGIVHAAKAQLIDSGNTTSIGTSDRSSSAATVASLPRSRAMSSKGDSKTPRARRGTVRELVREFVMANPGSKETHFAALHPEVKRSSYFMAYQSLEKEGFIRRDGLYFFPASMQWFPETEPVPTINVDNDVSFGPPAPEQQHDQAAA
jgi:hypothetical protein